MLQRAAEAPGTKKTRLRECMKRSESMTWWCIRAAAGTYLPSFPCCLRWQKSWVLGRSQSMAERRNILTWGKSAKRHSTGSSKNNGPVLRSGSESRMFSCQPIILAISCQPIILAILCQHNNHCISTNGFYALLPYLFANWL